MSQQLRQKYLRYIPNVDHILSKPEMVQLGNRYPKGIILEAVRRGLEQLRQTIMTAQNPGELDESIFSFEHLLPQFMEEIENQVKPTLRRVINATGVVIHTNLGRSLLFEGAIEHIAQVSRHYSNLEFDLNEGKRGSRYAHVEEILCRLTGAEAALVVNNNAAAVLLVLNTISEGREVIVSRGQLVEIGGAFRIPDVMNRSGAILREVGTTNRTHLKDYEGAIGEQTALILKVHTSNFRIIGFTAEVELKELAELAHSHNLPVMEDLGSGCLIDLSKYGLDREPTVQEAIKEDADIVTFSGDKLMGGPQAGIILGKAEYIQRIKVNPLNRAMRIDKLTLAGLESTLLLYLDETSAVREIPTLRMLTYSHDELRKRAQKLYRKIRARIPSGLRIGVRDDVSQVGGGAYPIQSLPTKVITLKIDNGAVHQLEKRLREAKPPIIARVSKEEVLLDVRTIGDDEGDLIVDGIEKSLRQGL
ncbi:MAG: L-seryl-tRNA(Sec) selenium transferase [Syntrophobacterales bacterium]|nr:MAG: L-seryl-tRNA(Sec) selenium transferase [Syntrophobacterales bacterium]